MWIKKPKRSDFRAKLSVGIVLFAFLLFSAFRLALFIFHHTTFEALSFGQVLSAFFNGIRFDLSVIALFLGPVILLFNLPVNSVRYMKCCVMFIALELMVMAGFLVADLIYFPYVKRHIAEEILQISAGWTWMLIKGMGIQLRLPVLLSVPKGIRSSRRNVLKATSRYRYSDMTSTSMEEMTAKAIMPMTVAPT